jgi:hypothetical protein
MDVSATAKGILRSLSEGIRTLVVLDEKLSLLGKENDRRSIEIRTAIENLSRLVGKLDEMDKRITERFSELDKRLVEFERRIDIKVELVVRDHLDKLEPPAPSRISVRNS